MTVRIPVARPVIALTIVENPRLLASPIAKDVVSEDALRFTILLPISIELRSLVGSSTSLSTKAAFLTFSSAIDLMRILLTVVRHVSADEKNAEKTNRISKTIIREASLESKKNQLPSYNIM